MFFFGANRHGAPFCSDPPDNQSRTGHQVDFEDVVNPHFERNLEAFAQTGRWSDNVKLRSFRQENDPSLAGLVEVNRYEGCCCAVHSCGGRTILLAGYSWESWLQRHYCQGRSKSFPPRRSKRGPLNCLIGCFPLTLVAAGAEPCDARRAARLGRSGSRLQSQSP